MLTSTIGQVQPRFFLEIPRSSNFILEVQEKLSVLADQIIW